MTGLEGIEREQRLAREKPNRMEGCLVEAARDRKRGEKRP